MTEQKVSRRYATAIYDNSMSIGQTKQVHEDFQYISSLLKSSKDLMVMFRSPVIQKWKKQDVIEVLLKDKVSDITYKFLKLLTDKQRENLIPDIIFQFEFVYNEANNIQKIMVVSAHELNDTLRSKIIDSVSEWTGKKIISDFTVDPKLIGGVFIRVENWVYDATVARQLTLLRQKLIEGNGL